MSELGLHDPYRLFNEHERKYTHSNKRCKTQSRLDFFLVDNNVINFPVCSSVISHGFRSDHSYVKLSLKGNKIAHGKGYWKLNNSLLEIPEYCREIESIIRDTLNDDFDSWGGVWDVIKFKIKDHSIRVGKTRKNNRRNLKKELEASIDSINDKIRYGDGDLEELYSQLHESQHQLNNIISEEINKNRGHLTSPVYMFIKSMQVK